MPNATQSWADQQAVLSSWSTPVADYGDATFANCAGQDYLYCDYDVLVGTNWLHAEVNNLDSHEDATPVIRALIESVAAAEPLQPVSSTTNTFPDSCAEWLTPEQISAAVGIDGIAERELPLMMPIVLNEALNSGLSYSWSNSPRPHWPNSPAEPAQISIPHPFG